MLLELDEAYKHILKQGLKAIRSAAAAGDLARVHAEAEHLHNIPPLIGEADVRRHLIYIASDRQYYVTWIRENLSPQEILEAFSLYAQHWDRITDFLRRVSD